MNRFLYRIYLFVSAIVHWLQRRLTPGGWLILVGLILAAGLGADPEKAIAYQGFAILFSLLAIAIIWAPFFKVRLSAKRILPRFGTVGQLLHYSVLLHNHTNRLQRGLTLLENLSNPPVTFEEFVGSSRAQHSFQLTRPSVARGPAMLRDTPLPVLQPKGETAVTVQLLPLRRGSLRFAGLTVARTDPIGLFRAFSNFPVSQSLLILPRRYPLPPLALPGNSRYQPGGVAMAMSVGESEEFVSLREYRRGDPLRHIHWKSWAKTGKPIVRQFEDEFFVRHALVLDTFLGKASPEIFEEAVSIAASFASTVTTQESLLDLMFVGPQAFCFTAGRALAHTDQMLEILASVQPCPDKTVEDLANLVLEHSPVLSGCICIFLAWDKSRQEFVRRMQMMGLPLMAIVVVEKGNARALTQNPPEALPECLHVLESGRIEEGLQALR